MRPDKLLKIFSLALIIGCAPIYAQTTGGVTIGSGIEPVSGAMLQLKENGNSDANSSKGLGLPRVTLLSATDVATITGMASNTGAHIGLTVYHVKAGASTLESGVYTWAGVAWIALTNVDVDTTSNPWNKQGTTDIAQSGDNKIYLYTTDGSKGPTSVAINKNTVGTGLTLDVAGNTAVTGKVGINNTTPTKDLDVNGDVQIKGKIFVKESEGATDNQLSSGEGAQVLVSGGSTKNPYWATLAIPQVEVGGFYLQASQVVRDDVGLLFANNATGGIAQYADGTPLTSLLSSGWKTFGGLDARITIPEYTDKGDGAIYNRTNFHLETTVMQPQAANSTAWTTFAIGILVQLEGTSDYILKGVRVGRMEGWYGAFMTTDVVCLVDNLPAGTHNVRVAAVRRANMDYDLGGDTNFAIGRSAPTFNTVNAFMCQTNMKIEIFKRDTTTITP